MSNNQVSESEICGMKSTKNTWLVAKYSSFGGHPIGSPFAKEVAVPMTLSVVRMR